MKRFGTLLSACVLLAGCNTKPEGQVIATVNGEEITRQEFNAALAQVHPDPKADKAVIQNMVLERLVTQHLVTQAAKGDGLDKSQDYIQQSRAANDAILSGLFARKITSALTTPYERDITAFMAANPWRFAQRVVYGLDQLRVRRADFKGEWMTGINTLDEAGQRLAEHKVPFERGRVALDSGTLSSSDVKQMNALAPGQPFASAQNDFIFISVIAGKQAAPVEGDQAHEIAVALLKQQTGQQALTNRVKALRGSAKVEYQDGFSAPKVKS